MTGVEDRGSPAIPDSWIRPEPLQRPARMRAGQRADTQLVCGVGPYELDVLVREFACGGDLELLGQVTRAERIHEPVSDLEMQLIVAPACTRIGATQTDQFGEFAFGRQPEAAYGLRLGPGEDAPCVLVWEGVR
ncbi:MAG: hypothetical protein GY946_23215 [bacterium]|nr:hypothetical protein [bacterium]